MLCHWLLSHKNKILLLCTIIVSFIMCIISCTGGRKVSKKDYTKNFIIALRRKTFFCSFISSLELALHKCRLARHQANLRIVLDAWAVEWVEVECRVNHRLPKWTWRQDCGLSRFDGHRGRLLLKYDILQHILELYGGDLSAGGGRRWAERGYGFVRIVWLHLRRDGCVIN